MNEVVTAREVIDKALQEPEPRGNRMNQEDIADLLGVFANSLTPTERYEFSLCNARAFGAHCVDNHRAEYAMCDNPACRAGFEIEILCDLYRDHPLTLSVGGDWPGGTAKRKDVKHGKEIEREKGKDGNAESSAKTVC